MSNRRSRAALVPVEQDSVPFHGHELIAVRLADGQIAVILRWLCDSLHLDTQGQQQRIERKTALADGLVTVRVDTAGGMQDMQALTLDVLPGYLFTIDENRVKAEARADVVLFQRECVKVLAEHFAHKRHNLSALATPQSLAVVDPQLTGQVAQITEQIVDRSPRLKPGDSWADDRSQGKPGASYTVIGRWVIPPAPQA